MRVACAGHAWRRDGASAREPRLEHVPDPSTYRPRPGEIPVEPGVYRFRDPRGRVVYVGKAKSLRSRLSSYFQDIAALHPRTQQMVTTAGSVEWTVVANEVEALQLEYAWIKEFDPRFNVKYRDDKSYPYLAVTMGEDYPRVQVMRGAKRKGTRYFGPYSHAWAIRETVDQLLRVFPVRTCSAGRLQAQPPDRPALPARLHRQVLGAVCRPGQRGGAPRAGRGLLRLHGRQHRPLRPRAGAGHAGRRGRARLRAGGPAARRHRRPGASPGAQRGRPRRRHRRRRLRPGRGRARGGGPGLPRPRRPDPRPARLGGREGRGPLHARTGRAPPPAGVRRGDRRRRAPRGPGARAARRRRRHRGLARDPARLAGRPARARGAATSAR